jgi:hypothetical protein
MIDLPRLTEPSTSIEGLTQFGRSLVNILKWKDAPQMVIDGVLKFDFSQTGNLAFIHTM